MGAVSTKVLSAVRASSRTRATLRSSQAEYHDINVSSAPRVPIGMLWNVEGNGMQDTLHTAGDKFFATAPLPFHKFNDGTGPQVWRDGGGLGDMMHPPDPKWRDAFSTY
ncbi:Hypp7732 [Branchiostoma lanceolatum]|uniref:Hypp7732 protein n=1 Tax=Branchiostoma lanceolatum TaxID=7740 RepID=A0A8J9Z3I1_BRALA|nr:Hypp7732 [Branchiostoma lanceolatum]